MHSLPLVVIDCSSPSFVPISSILPIQFPLSSCQRDVLASRNPPQLWRVVLTDSVQISAPLDKVITQPLLAVLDESSADKVSWSLEV